MTYPIQRMGHSLPKSLGKSTRASPDSSCCARTAKHCDVARRGKLCILVGNANRCLTRRRSLIMDRPLDLLPVPSPAASSPRLRATSRAGWTLQIVCSDQTEVRAESGSQAGVHCVDAKRSPPALSVFLYEGHQL